MGRSRRAVAQQPKLEFDFDADEAGKAYDRMKTTATTLAKHEADRTNKYRALAKAARGFLVTLFPIDQLDQLKRRISQYDRDVSIHLPETISKFLLERDLPEPYWTARNPFLGIIQAVWADAINGDPKIGTNIAMADGLPAISKTNISPDDVADLAKGKPEDQDKISDVGGKTANATYVMISRWAMLVCASIDCNDATILDQNPIRALTDYVEWRKTNATLALPKPTTPRPKKDDDGGGEPAELTPEEVAEQRKKLDEELEAGEAAFIGDAGATSEAKSETTSEAADKPTTEATTEPSETTSATGSVEGETPVPTVASDARNVPVTETTSPVSETTDFVVQVPRDLISTGDAAYAERLVENLSARGIVPITMAPTDDNTEVETWVRAKGQWYGPMTSPVITAVVIDRIVTDHEKEAA